MSFDKQPQRLNQLKSRLASHFPTPEEWADHADREQVVELIHDLNAQKSTAQTIAWSHKLLPSQLDLLFFALPLSVEYPEIFNDKTTDKLYLVIRERACPSLYPKLWALWQRYYFYPELNRALSILCGILEIKRGAFADRQPKDPALVSAAQEKRAPLPLITQLIPLNSRNLARRLIQKLNSYPLSLADFYERYAVNMSSRFGEAVLFYALTEGTAEMFICQIDRLSGLFQSADQAGKAAILRHFATLSDLPEAISRQAHVIFYTALGAPGGSNAIWTELNDREIKVFARWAGRARMDAHFQNRPDVAAFYLRYANDITRIEQWDDHTLLIHFKSFRIADDQRYPDQALFYAGTSPSRYPDGLAESEPVTSPGNPSIPHKQIGEILRLGEIQGIVQLHLDAEGLKEAGVLLDFALQSRSRGSFFPNSWLK